MEIQGIASTTARLGAIGLAALWVGAPATADVVNIDFEGDPPNDVTHSGNDGVLSVAGSVWNGVEAGVDTPSLLDDSGTATGVDLVFTAAGGGTTDSSATNDLQDSGSFRSFTLKGFSELVEYDIAVYAMPFSFLGFIDAGGITGGPCTGSAPSYALPGTLGEDYCLFEGRMPADLGGGEYGFTISGLDGVVTGLQIVGGDPPDVPLLSLPGVLGLALCFVGFGGRQLSSRT
jgi:hypothetical protein